MNDFRKELIQVAAVAIAIVTDIDQGNTEIRVTSEGFTAHDLVLCDVQDERSRQERKWGSQHHTPFEWLAILGEEYGEACQAAVDAYQWEEST